LNGNLDFNDEDII